MDTLETNNNLSIIPPIFIDPELNTIKNEHDMYDIYVNDNYIGKKVLLTQTENLNDIADFLKVQGVENVSTSLDGDHYVIKTNDSEKVKSIIETYLKNK